MGATRLLANQLLPWCECWLYLKPFQIMLLLNSQTLIIEVWTRWHEGREQVKGDQMGSCQEMGLTSLQS